MRIEGVGVFLVAVVELNGLVDVLIVLLVGGQDEVGFEGVLLSTRSGTSAAGSSQLISSSSTAATR